MNADIDEDNFIQEEPKEDTAALTKKLEQNKNCLQMLKAMDERDEAYIQRVTGKIAEIKGRLEAAQPVSQRLSALEKAQNQRKVIRTSKNDKIEKRKTYIQNLLDEQNKWQAEVKDLDAEIAEDERKIQSVKVEAGRTVVAEGKPIIEPTTLALIEAMPQEEKAYVLQKKLEFEQALASRKPDQTQISSGSQPPAAATTPQDSNQDYTFQELAYDEFSPDEIIPQFESLGTDWLPTTSQDPAVWQKAIETYNSLQARNLEKFKTSASAAKRAHEAVEKIKSHTDESGKRGKIMVGVKRALKK